MDSPGTIDCVFPLKQQLQSDRVQLTAWNPSLHNQVFFDASVTTPSLFDYMPWGPFSSPEVLSTSISKIILNDPKWCLFAVYAKEGLPDKNGIVVGPGGRFAGTIGLLNSVHHDATTEIGVVMMLPAFQRTCVSSHAIGLLLHELLDPLPPYDTGLGLRRVQWQCHSDNVASRRSAERIGFRLEGINKWCRVLPEGKQGAKVTSKGRMFGEAQPGRHSCMLAIDWEDWEAAEGTREKVDGLMGR